MCGTPSGRPSSLTASRECMCSPSVPSEPLFLLILPSPRGWRSSSPCRSRCTAPSAGPACAAACAPGAAPGCSPASPPSRPAGRSSGSSPSPPRGPCGPLPGTTPWAAPTASGRSAPSACSSVHRPAARRRTRCPPTRRAAARPGGLAHADPVGGRQRGALMAVRLDERLGEQGAIAVAVLEVVGHAAPAQRSAGARAAVPGGGQLDAAARVKESKPLKGWRRSDSARACPRDDTEQVQKLSTTCGAWAGRAGVGPVRRAAAGKGSVPELPTATHRTRPARTVTIHAVRTRHMPVKTRLLHCTQATVPPATVQ